MEGRSAPWPSPAALDLEDLLDELRSRASEARASQQRLAALLDAVLAVSADLELSEVLGHIVDAGRSLVNARYGALGVLSQDGDELSAFITRGLTEQQRRAIGHLPQGRGVLGLLIREPRPQRLPEVAAHPDSVGFPPNHPPMHSFLGVPIQIRERVFGNLYLADKAGSEEFSAEDESMLVALAAAAGVAIDNAQLYERTRQQRQWSEAISELTRLLLESEDEDSALEPLVLQAARFVSADFVAVALVDEANDLIVRAGYTNDDRSDPPTSAWTTGSILAGPAWDAVRQAGQPLLLKGSTSGEAVRNDGRPEVLAELSAHGPVALLPVAVGSDELGLLLIAWAGAFPESPGETMTALGGFAHQTALALVAGRAQRDRSRMTLLEDRERIARDLHDHVIQRLFATGLSLQSATRLAQHPLVRARLDDAVDELDESIRHIRHTIFELHRPIPSGGLRDELGSLVDSSAVAMGFSPTLRIDGSLAGLSGSLQADIVAVLREALSNIARHAHASRADVQITAGDSIQVVVTDDGIGSDPGTARSGLVNLGSRAAARSGTFGVRPAGSHGNVLCWEVPREARGTGP